MIPVVISLKNYAEIREMPLQKALEECKEAEALLYKGSKILVDIKKVNKYMEAETIEGLKNINSLEVV